MGESQPEGMQPHCLTPLGVWHLASQQRHSPQRVKSKKKTALREKKNDTNNNMTKPSHISNGCEQILCIIWQNMIKVTPVSSLRGQIWFTRKLYILQGFPVSLRSDLQLAFLGYWSGVSWGLPLSWPGAAG